MQLVIHAGAHFTEENRLVKSLLRNKSLLHSQGVTVPGPGKYKTLLRETLVAMGDTGLSAQARDTLLDAILDGETADRVVLSSAHVLGWPRAAIRRGRIYPSAPDRIALLTTLFCDEDIELFMAIRNPATFIPSCFQKHPEEDILEYLGGIDPRRFRWSDTFKAIRSAAPEVPITVWCNEEAPFLWSQIIRDMGGLGYHEPITGGFDLFASIISNDGLGRFTDYIQSKPDISEIHTRRVMAAFLEKFAIDEEVEEEVDVQGWSVELVDEMTELYEEDIATIARIPGVELLTV